MRAKNEERLKLIIISGFLGAGKTTFLQHFLNNVEKITTHVIINEVAEYSVDDIFFEKASLITKIVGGCVCCSKKGIFLQTLHSICSLRTSKVSSDKGRVERILVETSGVSDPASIYDGIVNDVILSKHIIVEKVIVLINGASDLLELQSEKLIRNQILYAEEIFISKSDLVDQLRINDIVNFLFMLNPSIKIRLTVKGEIEPIETKDIRKTKNIFNNPKSLLNNIDELTTMRIPLKNNTDWNSLVIWLSALLYCHGKNILRVKGVVSSPAGPLLLQGVGKHIQKPQKLPKNFTMEDKYLILIGRNISKRKILNSTHFLQLKS